MCPSPSDHARLTHARPRPRQRAPPPLIFGKLRRVAWRRAEVVLGENVRLAGGVLDAPQQLLAGFPFRFSRRAASAGAAPLCGPQRFPLVPKLHFGTHLSSPFHGVQVAPAFGAGGTPGRGNFWSVSRGHSSSTASNARGLAQANSSARWIVRSEKRLRVGAAGTPSAHQLHGKALPVDLLDGGRRAAGRDHHPDGFDAVNFGAGCVFHEVGEGLRPLRDHYVY